MPFQSPFLLGISCLLRARDVGLAVVDEANRWGRLVSRGELCTVCMADADEWGRDVSEGLHMRGLLASWTGCVLGLVELFAQVGHGLAGSPNFLFYNFFFFFFSKTNIENKLQLKKSSNKFCKICKIKLYTTRHPHLGNIK